MTTLERDLDELRGRLRAAVAADLRRRARRRRRIAQLAAVPALGLSLTGVALAAAPWWNEPAPTRVQGTFDDTTLAGTPDAATVRPQGGPLHLRARDGQLALYGSAPAAGTWCVFVDRGMPVAQFCSDAERPAPGEIRLDSAGGAGNHDANIVSGQVAAPAAKTVTINLPDRPEAAVVDVGHDGWFIVQMPDSTLATNGDPRSGEVSAVARDAEGEVVARSRRPR